MVAMSLVISSKSAKIIFARQFVPITRREIEEYIVQFSRNIDSCKEITHLDSDKVRYLFIPIDSYYLILITSRNSNIIEDTEILKLIYRLIQDICGSITYDNIIDKSFEIMLGIDDIVTLGYRSGANIAQIQQYLSMESLEEKEFKRKKLEQEMRVMKELQEKGREFDKLKKEKKFNTGAVSSSNFVFYDEKEENEEEDGNKKSKKDKNKDIDNKDEFKEEDNESKKEDKENKDNEEEALKGENKKKKKGGMKLTKKKVYN